VGRRGQLRGSHLRVLFGVREEANIPSGFFEGGRAWKHTARVLANVS
jgi:hypothetical protein